MIPSSPKVDAFGRYCTHDLILAYMNALAAGDVETVLPACLAGRQATKPQKYGLMQTLLTRKNENI